MEHKNETSQILPQTCPDSTKTDEVLQNKTEVPKRKGKEEKQPTKVVIRKLPGSMTEQSFLESVSPLFDHDYFYFIEGENPSFGEFNYSRAYINFLNMDDVFNFTSKFDDYVFLDNTGQEYPALVEYAPFQRIPKNRNRKNDSLCGTIDEDPEFQEFLRQLESEEHDHKPNQITEHYFDLANDDNEEKVTTTPLIEYITSRKNEWMKYKEEKKEERRRRDIERRKLKEETKRTKKEAKETIKTKPVEKTKDEKIKDVEKPVDEIKTKVKGKSYQEERQRDLARRKMEEKSAKSDVKDAKEALESGKASSSDHISEKDTEKVDKDVKDEKRERESKYEDDRRKRSFEDKKVYREDDRRSGTYSREKDEKKAHSYGIKKREFANGFDHDGKYKTSKSSGYYYDDYKSRNSSSFQKNSYTNKYGTNKSKDFDEKNNKRFDSKSKKYDSVDYKDTKKSYQWERENKKPVDVKDSDKKLNPEGDAVPKEKIDDITKTDKNLAESKTAVVNDGGNDGANAESNRAKDKSDDKKDDRAERRIKNKDRPALEIYRPGMGKFSRQRLERNKSTDSKEALYSCGDPSKPCRAANVLRARSKYFSDPFGWASVGSSACQPLSSQFWRSICQLGGRLETKLWRLWRIPQILDTASLKRLSTGPRTATTAPTCFGDSCNKDPFAKVNKMAVCLD
ncbi:hypothetical protein V9T40_003434 [Parthenolecanium corni]|uniref:UPF3 domain-containing protein n=1 Tax=Parthenolecanium corni TaxID=536013 RepID=A0AAN9TQP4_9HEMI